VSVWGELKRRNVVKVGVAYAIIAWLVAQIAMQLFPALLLPDWLGRAVVAVLILGFPIALLLAWVYEVTPEGIKKTRDVPLEQSITNVTGHKLNYVVTALLAIAVVFLIVDNYWLTDDDAETVAAVPPAPVPVEPEAERPTIVVIPFVNISSDPEQEYFVDGLSEELMNQLAQIDGLLVTARTSAFAFKGTTETVASIGEKLGVGHVLEGSVRKAGNRLLITAQLVATGDGFHLWSDTYDRELGDIFAIQEDIGREVVVALKVKLGIGEEFPPVGGTQNIEAYELYLAATARGRTGLNFIEVNESLRLLDRALELDPNFALGWAHKARATLSLRLDPERDGAALQATAEQAAQRAVELAPTSTIARAAIVSAAIYRGDWVQAELMHREVFALGGTPSNGLLKHIVGHLSEARDRLLLDQREDPLNDGTVAFVAAVHDSLGDLSAANAQYARGQEVFNPWIAGVFNQTITNLGVDDFDPREDGTFFVIRIPQFAPVVRSAMHPAFDPIIANWADPLAARDATRQAYAALEQVPATLRGLARLVVGAAAARFDDPELALTAFEETMSWGPGQLYLIWRPVFRDMRQLPRFKEFAREVGLVAYWQTYGWPDLCRPVGDDGDFECD
jgi:TolB-like protein/tetratricopeptide (TPR) repeat protein